MPEPLPRSWVQRIFAKLAVRYGTMFKNRYAGLDEAEVWADWAEVLAGLQSRPEAIAHAIASLPADSPPTATQFRDLCQRAPVMATKALPPPDAKANPELLAKLKDVVTLRASHSIAWAVALARKEAWQDENPRAVSRHERLTLAQRSMWRRALGVDGSTGAAQALETRL